MTDLLGAEAAEILRPPEETLPQYNIGLYLVSIHQTSYLIAKTLALAGCRVWACAEPSLAEVTSSAENPAWPQRLYFSWLYSEEGVSVMPSASGVPPLDAFLYEIGHLKPRFPDRLEDWMRAARRRVAWNTTDEERGRLANLRSELGTAYRYRRFISRARSVVVGSGAVYGRVASMFRTSERQGHFVHPMFLRDPLLRRDMFGREWLPGTARPIRLAFAGNPQPAGRTRILEPIARLLSRQPGIRISKDYREFSAETCLLHNRLAQKPLAVLWLAAAPAAGGRSKADSESIPLSDWPRILQMCDFSLCPPGYEKKTHRVVESLLHGAIPILDCPEEYDIGLRDGENCIAVAGDDWTSAVKRSFDLNFERIRSMRERVRSIAVGPLQVAGTAHKWLCKLGVTR